MKPSSSCFRTNPRRRLSLWALCLPALFQLSPFSMQAGTHIWKGGTSNRLWSTASNWTGGAPSPLENPPVIVVFPNTFVGSTTNDIAGLNVDSLQLLGSGQVLHGRFGSSITLRGGHAATNIFNLGVNHITESMPMTLEGTNRIATTIGLTFMNSIGGTGSLVMEGNVAMTGEIANTYTGSTVLESGLLTLNRHDITLTGPVMRKCLNGPLGVKGGTVRFRQDDQLDSAVEVTVEPGGEVDLNDHSQTIASLLMKGGEVKTGDGVLTVDGPIAGRGFSAIIRGKISLGGESRTIDVSQLSGLTIEASIMNGAPLSHPGVTKTGPGTLVLAGANTFTGPVNVNRGTVMAGHDSALGSSLLFGTSVASNATLRILDGVQVAAEQLKLDSASLYAEGFSEWSGPIELNGACRIDALAAGDQFRVKGAIRGPGGLTHAGHGRLILGGTADNTYEGQTFLAEGDLHLEKLNGRICIPGDLVVGKSANTNNENTLLIQRADQIADSAKVTVQSSGVIWMSNVDDTVGQLVLQGGEVNTGTGVLMLRGDITARESAELSRITGRLDLGGGLRTVEVEESEVIPALWIKAAVSGVEGSGIRKTGLGTLWMSGDNTYDGETIISAGEWFMDHPNALGQSTALAVSGTTVEKGATLNTTLPISTVMERLVLDGDGQQSRGAWIVQGANQTWGGKIHFNGISRIYVNEGTALVLTNLVTGPGTFHKVGDGILTFAGRVINTFQGRAVVEAGRVHCGKPDGFTSISGGVDIQGTGKSGDTPPMVKLYSDKQINDEGSWVSLSRGGILDLNGHVEDIRYLLGIHSDAEIRVGSGELRVFQGSFAGGISGTGMLRKWTADRLSLFGALTYTGETWIEEGRLDVFKSMASTQVKAFPGARLGGDGSLMSVSMNQATLLPGLFTAFNTAQMQFENLHMTNGSVFVAEIRGDKPGGGHDQLKVNGTVRLHQSQLEVKLGYPGAANRTYTLIQNGGSDAVQGVFSGKPEGGTFSAGGAEFRISYQGGDGNDVVLTQLTASTADFSVRLQIEKVSGTDQVAVSWPTHASDYDLFRCVDPQLNEWKQIFGTKTVINDRFHQYFSTTNALGLFQLQLPEK